MKTWYKNLLVVLMTLMAVPVMGQGLNFELGFNNSYHQVPEAMLCVDDYSYMA
ncbi:MAG: hypothetical protein ACI8XB_001426 [Patiriisocius sp.]|jgi:hypothetical protein